MRTSFSDNNWLMIICTDDIESVHNQLSYFMWDTSIAAMSSVGVPTDEDVIEWINTLKQRTDSESNEVKYCIADCEDYINGTMNALHMVSPYA